MAKKILLVDDEPFIVKVVETRLAANGYDVVSAIDGEDGLNKAKSEKPDLIILDVMLPKIEGYEVARRLKEDDQYKNIPILMLTARVQKADQEQSMKSGADAFLTKPFEAQALLSKIKELLQK